MEGGAKRGFSPKIQSPVADGSFQRTIQAGIALYPLCNRLLSLMYFITIFLTIPIEKKYIKFPTNVYSNVQRDELIFL